MLNLEVEQAVAIGIGIAAVFTLLGCGIGFYASEKDQEHKSHRVLDSVATTPNRTIDKRSMAMGYVVGQQTLPPN